MILQPAFETKFYKNQIITGKPVTLPVLNPDIKRTYMSTRFSAGANVCTG